MSTQLADTTRFDAGSVLSPESANRFLREAGIPVIAQEFVRHPADVAAAARRIGGPVVVKAVAPGLVHRSEAGAVRLGLATPESAQAAASEMAERISDVSGFIVQRMAHDGLEFIVGIRQDPLFGPFVVIGSGGVLVELLRDSVLRQAPVTLEQAQQMLSELRSAPLLEGYRGSSARDHLALAEVVVAVSRLAAVDPRIREFDLNPVIVGTSGATAVDAHILLADDAGGAGAGDAYVPADLRHLLRPSSLVVIGASTDVRKPGGRLLSYLLRHEFAGSLYAVNPRVDEIMGVRSFPSIDDLPEVPDLACIVVPPGHVLDIVERCGELGVKAAIIYTSGFAEVGADGTALEREFARVARETGMRICGPNTAGLVNSHHSMCSAIGMAFEIDEMPRGEIAFLTQSGALGSSLLSRTWAEGIGFSTWICCGNECDLTLSDYLYHLADDEETKVVAVFMESIRDPESFVVAASRAREQDMPVLVYKTGVSEIGHQAVASHTAALAGDDEVYDAVLEANGIVRIGDLQQLADAAVALGWQPRPKGNRVGVVSASGGACSVIADACSRQGLDLPPVSDAAVERLKAIVPPFGVAQNPVDVTMSVTTRPQMIAEAAEVILAEPQIDALIVMLTTNAGEPALEVARGVAELAARSDKPILVVRVGAEALAPDSVKFYRTHRIPVYPMPERAVAALAAMVRVGVANVAAR